MDMEYGTTQSGRKIDNVPEGADSFTYRCRRITSLLQWRWKKEVPPKQWHILGPALRLSTEGEPDLPSSYLPYNSPASAVAEMSHGLYLSIKPHGVIT